MHRRQGGSHSARQLSAVGQLGVPSGGGHMRGRGRRHPGRTGAVDPRHRKARRRAARILGLTSWVLTVIGTLVGYLLRSPEHADALGWAVVAGLSMFFPMVIARLVLVATLERRRRIPLVVLAVSLTVFSAGSFLLQTQGPDVAAGLFSPSELAFVVAYVGFAIFLLLDAPRRRTRALAVWLETTVVCAGTASLAALVILTPLARRFDGHGVNLLLALLFPLIDVVLAILVI